MTFGVLQTCIHLIKWMLFEYRISSIAAQTMHTSQTCYSHPFGIHSANVKLLSNAQRINVRQQTKKPFIY